MESKQKIELEHNAKQLSKTGTSRTVQSVADGSGRERQKNSSSARMCTFTTNKRCSIKVSATIAVLDCLDRGRLHQILSLHEFFFFGMLVWQNANA